MKYDDLEKTQDIFDIASDVPSPIDNIEMEGINKDNVTDELTFGLMSESEEDMVEPQKEEIHSNLDTNKKDKKPKTSLKEKWHNISKKKKILIIVGSIILILAIIGLIVFVIFNNNDDEDKNNNNSKEPEIVVEKDNYIYKDGVLVFLNADEEEIGTYECKNKDESLCFVSNFSNEDSFDGAKYVNEDETLLSITTPIYQNNYVFIYDNEDLEEETIILYNIKDEKNEGFYKLVKGYNDNNVVILKDNNDKYGVIEFTEDEIKELFEFSYQYIGRQNNSSSLVVKTNDKYFIYNLEGKLLSKALSYEIKSYSDKYIVVDNSGYYVYDYNANLIFDDAYDFVNLLDNYAVLIDNKELFIRDYKNNKYNEVGIELDNTYYNTMFVYDENNQLIDEKKSFAVSIDEDEFVIDYYVNNKKKTKKLDITDGTMSAKYDYINYFDGKLYFYKDEEESELLGSYSCSNKNSDDMTNCVIATDSFYSDNEVETNRSADVGWIPIFNQRYVFILDSMDSNNPTIILYDLKDKKTLSKYTSVDTGSYTKETKVTFIDTDATYVMAKNKSSKYGIIRIGDAVSGTVNFNYSSMEKLRDYYVVGESSGTYMLINNVGQNITSKYGYKIVDYVDNYLKVVNDNKYYIYDFNGNKVDETGYLAIELANNYYVTVNNSKQLDIRKYTDLEFGLSELIPLGSDYKNDYTVTMSSDGSFIIKVKSTNKTYNADNLGNII